MTAAEYGLSEGCLKAMLLNVPTEPVTVQLLDTRTINPSNSAGPTRYRLHLNDGRHSFTYAMLGTSLNPRLEGGEFPPFSIVTIEKYVCNTQGTNNSKKVLIILNLSTKISGTEIGQKIGNPIPLSDIGEVIPPGLRPNAVAPVNGNSGVRPPVANHGTFGGGGFGAANQSNTGFSGGFGGNQQRTFGNGNSMADGNRPQSNGSGQKNMNPGFANEPPAKRPANFGPQSTGGNQMRPNMPQASGTSFRQQNPTYPNAGERFSGGHGGGFRNDSGNNTSMNAGAGGGFGNMEGFGEGETPQNVFPLMGLNPHQNCWTIRVCVKNKEALRHYTNVKGQGQLVSMTLQDESDEMKCTAFGENATKYNEMMEVGKWYYIRNAQVSEVNNKKFSRGKDYEMVMRGDTLVKLDAAGLDKPKVSFSFTAIDGLSDKLPDSTVDVIGICTSVGPVSSFTSKAGKALTKREIELRDKTCSVRVTLWGDEAERFDEASEGHVVAIKGCNVSEFGGRTLSSTRGCDIVIDPEIKESHTLRGWYQTQGNNTVARSISSAPMTGGNTVWKNLAMIREQQDQGQAYGAVADYFQMKGTIMKVDNKDRMMLYKGCPGAAAPMANGRPTSSSSCNKKLLDTADGTYRCEKCAQTYDNFVWRLMLQVEIADFGGAIKFVSVFQEHAEFIIGQPGDRLGQLSVDDKAEFDKLIDSIVFKSFIFKIKAQTSSFMEKERMKYSVVKVDPLDFTTYTKHLADGIKSLTQPAHIR